MAESEPRLTNVVAAESMGLRSEVGYAAASGAAAGLFFGVVLQLIGAMGDVAGILTVGASTNPILGWVLHLALSAAFGGLWGVVADVDRLSSFARSPSTGLTLGALFGFALWFVNVGLLLPLWATNVIGVYVPFPYLTQTASLLPMLGHLLWGAMLGFLFPLTRF